MPPVNRGKSSKNKKENVERQKRILSSKEKILNIKRNLLAIIEAMLEKEVSQEWFLKNCVKLCHADYDDVVEERSIEHLCGYPLCSNIITETMQQKYHISLVVNKVYDITERKSYCSNQCYKASKYLKVQLSPVPLYMRKEEEIKVNLLSESNNRGSVGEEVQFHHKLSQDEMEKVYIPEEISKQLNNILHEEIKQCADTMADLKIKEHVFEKQFVFEGQTAVETTQDPIAEDKNESDESEEFDSDDSRDKNLFSNYDNMEVLLNTHMPVPSKMTKSLLISALKPNIAASPPIQKLSLDFISNIFKDWMTEDSLKYLLGERYVYGVKADHLFEKMTASDPITPEKLSSVKNDYINMCLKIDSLRDDDDISDSTEIEFIYVSGEISSVDTKKIVEADDSTGKNIFKRRPKNKSKEKYKHVTFASNVDTSDGDKKILIEEKRSVPVESKSASNADTSHEGKSIPVLESETPHEESPHQSSVPEPGFPLVDSVSQNALRRQVLMSKLKSVYFDILPVIGLHYTDIREGVKKFVETLSLTPSNIMFKPKEWKLISLILLRLLTRTVLKCIYDDAQFMKLCEDPTLNINIDVQEIERMVYDILSPENIITSQ